MVNQLIDIKLTLSNIQDENKKQKEQLEKKEQIVKHLDGNYSTLNDVIQMKSYICCLRKLQLQKDCSDKNQSDNFQLAGQTRHRKQHKNNQRAGGLITRLPAFILCLQVPFFRRCSIEPSLNTPRKNMVKLYHVQCSNEPMPVRLLSKPR